MRKPFESQIGELCRNGKTIFYAFIDGEEVETDCREQLVRMLYRRSTDRNFRNLY